MCSFEQTKVNAFDQTVRIALTLQRSERGLTNMRELWPYVQEITPIPAYPISKGPQVYGHNAL